jgi:hypothetical protein
MIPEIEIVTVRGNPVTVLARSGLVRAPAQTIAPDSCSCSSRFVGVPIGSAITWRGRGTVAPQVSR